MSSSNEKMNQDSGFKDLISSCEKLAEEVIVTFIKEEYEEDKPTLKETRKSSNVDFFNMSEATNNDLLTTIESEIAGKVFINKLFQNYTSKKKV